MNTEAKPEALTERFGERRPPNWLDGIHKGRPHQRGSLPKEEDLDLVPSLEESIGMEKRERGLGRIIRTPGTLDQNLAHPSPSAILW